MTTNKKVVPKSRRGQARILEAVIAATILLLVFTATTFLINSTGSQKTQEKADIDRLGYNTLSRIVEEKTIENTIESGQDPETAASTLKALLQRSLPSSTYFNITISVCNQWQLTAITSATNVIDSADFFVNSLQISSTPTIYTSTKTGNIYNIVLVLARGG